MVDPHQNLANQLFAVVTAMLEDASEIAIAEQTSWLAPSRLAVHGRHLQAVARDIAVIAEAITIVTSLGRNDRPSARNIPR